MLNGEWLKTVVKLFVSALIIWIVLRSIDLDALARVLGTAHWGWLLWAAVWFVLSKVLAAFRLNDLLRTAADIQLNNPRQLRLYWLGMYYNLLLPGGISGDGYKIKVLMDRFGLPFKRLFSLLLFDRLSGMAALAQGCLCLLCVIPIFRPYWPLWCVLLAFSLPVCFILFKRMVGGTATTWRNNAGYAVAVQTAQWFSALGLVWALGEGGQWAAYSLLFWASSVVAMLPFTIGGTGARELTFLWGAHYLGTHPEQAVAIAFLFYIISTAVAFWGVVYSIKGWD